MAKRILINKSNTGFGLSKEAHELFLKKANFRYYEYTENFKKLFLKTQPLNYVAALKNATTSEEISRVKKEYIYYSKDVPRDHPVLWLVADIIGMDRFNDRFSKLEFVDVPDDAIWSIRVINDIEYISLKIIENENKKRNAGSSES